VAISTAKYSITSSFLPTVIQSANVNLPHQTTNDKIRRLSQFYRHQEHQQKATNQFFRKINLPASVKTRKL